MMRERPDLSQPALSMLALAGLVSGLAFGTVPAAAQSAACQDVQKILVERKSIVEQLNGLGKGKEKKVDAASACTMFTKLATNGSAGVKFIDANKEWCQIPDQFATGFKADHEKAVGIKNKACQAAAQQAKMMKMAREQAEKGGRGGAGGMLGGPGLTGEYKIPQGAL